MLSICIPVYNFDSRQLVNALRAQASELPVPVEILVIDDGSDALYADQYKSSFGSNTRVIILNENLGRARVRNMLVSEARFDNLLFLDCDIQITSTDYLKNYITIISQGYEVVCGGTQYPLNNQDDSKILHWKYGLTKQKELARRRNTDPYQSFMTNNFMIRKNIFEKIRFDESINRYGHEDTLFGYLLRKMKVGIKHIDNPVLHSVLDDNDVFLDKTEQAVKNLVQIRKTIGSDKDFTSSVALLKTWSGLRRIGMHHMVRAVSNSSISFLREKLSGGKASLFYLNLFKLFLLARENR